MVTGTHFLSYALRQWCTVPPQPQTRSRDTHRLKLRQWCAIPPQPQTPTDSSTFLTGVLTPFTLMSAAASLASPDSHSLSIRTMCRAREVSPECQPCVSLTHLSAFTPRRLTGDEVQIPSLARKVPQPPHLFLLPLVGPRILIPPGLCTSYFLSFKGLGIGAQLSP